MRRTTLLALALLAAAGCRQDMHDQPKLKPLAKSRFFADGRASRPRIEGTVARGQLRGRGPYDTGKDAAGNPVRELPVPVTRELTQRGRERYDIHCAPCHDRVGTGAGMIVQRGYKAPPSFHETRLREAPDGHFFDAVTNGFGVMPKYAAQIPLADRWAIVAYIRALQLSQGAVLADVPPAEQVALTGGTR